MMKLEDIKIGQKVWVVANWAHTPISGTVESIKYIGPSEPYAKVCWDSHFGTSGVLLDELYASLEDLQKEEKAKQDAADERITMKLAGVEVINGLHFNDIKEETKWFIENSRFNGKFNKKFKNKESRNKKLICMGLVLYECAVISLFWKLKSAFGIILFSSMTTMVLFLFVFVAFEELVNISLFSARKMLNEDFCKKLDNIQENDYDSLFCLLDDIINDYKYSCCNAESNACYSSILIFRDVIRDMRILINLQDNILNFTFDGIFAKFDYTSLDADVKCESLYSYQGVIKNAKIKEKMLVFTNNGLFLKEPY